MGLDHDPKLNHHRHAQVLWPHGVLYMFRRRQHCIISRSLCKDTLSMNIKGTDKSRILYVPSSVECLRNPCFPLVITNK